jgi:ABC-type glutathione transport system ATPase component
MRQAIGSPPSAKGRTGLTRTRHVPLIDSSPLGDSTPRKPGPGAGLVHPPIGGWCHPPARVRILAGRPIPLARRILAVGDNCEERIGAVAVIEVDRLHKVYGDKVAVDDVSFSVEEGEIFGVLGPNGAGKTTTVECVSGLRRPDGGSVRVVGYDPARDRAAVTARVGVQLQHSELQPNLRVGEATVKTHLLHLYDKLGVRDRAAAVAMAYERGLLG